MLLFLVWRVLRHPLRALRRGLWVFLGLVAVVVWVRFAVAHPTAAILAGLAFVVGIPVSRLMWRYGWPVLRPHIRIVLPDRLWYWRARLMWPRLAQAVGLTVRHPARRVPEVMGGQWVRNDYGWTIGGQLLAGQTPQMYAGAADMLRHAWLAYRVVVDTPWPGHVLLTVYLDDPLRTPVRAEPIRYNPDLWALRLGVREDGRVWTERLIGRHWLIAGATGAGKGSVAWGVIRAVCPLIKAGLVQVWTLDPKRIEFVMGAPLFARYEYAPEAMVEVVEEAARMVAERADRMAGLSRLHEPSVAEPLVVLNIDEIGALTAYVTDKKLRERLNAALAVVLTQGRALGVSVLGQVQDPRKEVVPLRQLFTTRIALRLDEASQVDLVLGVGALGRGAWCHLIPDTERDGAGIGYVTAAGSPMPYRFRAGHVTDADITDMVHRFGDPTQGIPVGDTS